MSLLPLGSVVKLKHGKQKVMNTVRLPLYNKERTTGYIDYGYILYPNVQVDYKTYFLNESDIEKLFFRGYIDESEESFQKKYKNELKNIQYQKLNLVQNSET